MAKIGLLVINMLQESTRQKTTLSREDAEKLNYAATRLLCIKRARMVSESFESSLKYDELLGRIYFQGVVDSCDRTAQE